MKVYAVLLLAVAATLAAAQQPDETEAPTKFGINQVGGDPNAADRFKVYRPRTGRVLNVEAQETVATTAPPASFGINQVGGDPNAADRFKVYRPRTGRVLNEEAGEAVAGAPPS